MKSFTSGHSDVPFSGLGKSLSDCKPVKVSREKTQVQGCPDNPAHLHQQTAWLPQTRPLGSQPRGELHSTDAWLAGSKVPWSPLWTLNPEMPKLSQVLRCLFYSIRSMRFEPMSSHKKWPLPSNIINKLVFLECLFCTKVSDLDLFTHFYPPHKSLR